VTPDGNYAVADHAQVRMVAARSGTFYGERMTRGHIYALAGKSLAGYAGDGGPATAALVNRPEGLAVDASGNLVIADSRNNRIRVVAARTGRYYGQAMTAGDIYTVAGNGSAGYAGDGGPARSASLYWPGDVAVDAAGNLVIADSNNNRIRVVAVRRGRFYGRSMAAGHIYTVAGNGTAGYLGTGGPAARAELSDPGGVAVDAHGNLVIADTGNSAIRVVAARSGRFYGRSMTAGDIYTVAGDGTAGYAGSGTPASAALLSNPVGVTMDVAGNLVIADTGNSRIRVIAVRSGRFYGQAMTAGDIYDVAGNGQGLFGGDGGPARQAELDSPDSVAVNAAGDLLIADTGNLRVRLVRP
jgi:trimeric autotransporter adhesin